MTVPSGELFGAMFGEQYWDHAAEIDAAAQAESDVVRARMPNGIYVWIVTRYSDAQVALADKRLCKRTELLDELIRQQLDEAVRPIPDRASLGRRFLFEEAENHAQLRNLLVNAFSDSRMRELQPRMERITTELLAQLPRTTVVDLITKFAWPLPVTVMGDVLGIPKSIRPVLLRWSEYVRQDPRRDPLAPAGMPSGAAGSAEQEMRVALADLIAARRTDPHDDLLSALATTTPAGDRLSDEDAVAAALLTVTTAHEVTATLLGNAARLLLDAPAMWWRLPDDPDLLDRAIEEVLRYDSPMRLAEPRCTIAPVTYGEVRIPAGQIVMISLAAANRDPEAFADADYLVWDRRDAPPLPHLAFGDGPHRCLGATLARMITRIALASLAKWFPDARLAVPARDLRRQPDVIRNSWQEVPVLLT